jgi:hypothetical protein
MAYTTTDLIAAVKSIASIPSSQNLFTTADFLRFANRAMRKKIIPLVMSTREEYWVASTDYAITADQANYAIPARAIGGKLRDIQWVDGSAMESLPRLEPENVSSTDIGREGFYLEANNVVLSPTPSETDGTLRVKHFRRPNELVATTACAAIESINTATNQVVVSSVPSTFTNGLEVDFVKSEPGYEWHAIDQVITGISGTTITFASLPSNLAEGDYVCVAGQSPVPQIPEDLIPILEDEVAEMCMKAQGKNTKAFREELEMDKQESLKMLTPRVDGEPKKIVGSKTLLNRFRRGF